MKQKKNYHVRIVIIITLIISFLLSCIPAFITFNLTILHQGNGTTNPNGEITINEDEALTITALPDENGIFENWEVLSGSGCRIDNVDNTATTVTLTSGNAVIQANFTAVMEGSFAINNDNSNTLTESVTLHINISGATEMRFGNTPGELNTASWETYAESKTWDLTPGIALKTVYGEFRDNEGHKYGTSDTIRLIKKIIASDGYTEDWFGKSVAISSDGSIVVVGAFGNGPGSVYVYNSTNWSIKKIITPSDGAASDYFGYSVAVSSDGSTIVVGAFADDDNGTGSGSVYVYDGTNWGAETKIPISDGAAGDSFGFSVAISSDCKTIAAGAYKDDDKGENSGSVYVFEYENFNWEQKVKITPSDGAANDEFGGCVAISSDASTIAVSAFGDDDNGTGSGSVYVHNGINWGTEKKIPVSDGASGDHFGVSLSISSDAGTIVVGAYNDDDNGEDSGSVYVYNGTNWGTKTKIKPSDGAEADCFGNYVSVSSNGSSIAAGAYYDDDKGTASGSVYIFNGTNWGTETKIVPCDGANYDYFGYSVAVTSDGNTIVVGARDDDDNGENSGSAYIIPLE